MRRAGLSLLSIVGLLLPGVAEAHKVPVGPTFQVNTYTTGEPGYRGVSVAADPDGDFVVVWSRYTAYDGSDVFGQRFDSTGAKQGSEFQVNTYTASYGSYEGFQGYAGVSVAADATGNFVVTWTSDDYSLYPIDDTHRVMGQRFDSAGAMLGGEFQIHTTGTPYPDSYRIRPAVAADPAGNFIVVWTDLGGDGYAWGVLGQRYDSAGVKQGGEFQVNTYTTGDQGYRRAAVAADAAGNFVVVWPGHDWPHLFGQRFDSAGARVGTEFQINSASQVAQIPAVASDAAGNFVVVWNGIDGYYTGVIARRYDSTGAAIGGEFQVNTYTTGDQGYRGLAVASDPDGNFVVTWGGKTSIGSYGVSVRQFDSTGAAVGEEFRLGDVGVQRFSLAVAADADGDFVVVWEGPGAGYSFDGVVAQRFGDPPLTCSSSPRDDCRQQTKARGAFRFRKNATNLARNSLAWRWPRGESTSNAEFGNVFTDVSYALCVYDGSPNPQPLLSAVVPPGGTCGPAAIPCWRELTGFGPPLFYLDGYRTQGGIVQLRLKAGATDNTRITTRARGENLTLPATPLTAPVVVQLQGSHGECFTATYAQRIRKNEGGVFRARPGSPSGAFLDAGAAVLD